MRIAMVTFEGFNEIDSFVTAHVLNRIQLEGWKAEITSPSETVQSMNGVRVRAQRPLEFVNEADAVLFGSGRLTREIVEDHGLMSGIRLDPRRQLIGSQCSGALFLVKLGLLGGLPVCTDLETRPFVEAIGTRVLDQTFFACGNVASAGGCLSSPHLATWITWRLLGREAAERGLEYVAPVGEREQYVAGVLAAVAPFVAPNVEHVSIGG